MMLWQNRFKDHTAISPAYDLMIANKNVNTTVPKRPHRDAFLMTQQKKEDKSICCETKDWMLLWSARRKNYRIGDNFNRHTELIVFHVSHSTRQNLYTETTWFLVQKKKWWFLVSVVFSGSQLTRCQGHVPMYSRTKVEKEFGWVINYPTEFF